MILLQVENKIINPKTKKSPIYWLMYFLVGFTKLKLKAKKGSPTRVCSVAEETEKERRKTSLGIYFLSKRDGD